MSNPSEYYGGVRSDVLSLLDTPPDGNILEIGGGDFHTLLSLSAPGNELWGADVRRPAVPPGNFVLGSITDAAVSSRLTDEHFDLIIANDVIEHIADTREFVSILRKKLKTSGKLLLSVPNIRQIRLAYYVFIKGTFPRQSAGLFDETHLRWFCRADVIELFTAAGFDMVTHRAVGRHVPKVLSRTTFAEFLALQNIFLFRAV